MSNFDLPDDCWELVFKFLNKPHHLDTLSLVSTHFLSITNNLVSSLKISNNILSLPYLPRLLTRFPNLRSLDLCHFEGDLHALLLHLSQSLSSLDSLKICIYNSFPANGFLALAQKIPSLKSLTLTNIDGAPITIFDVLLLLQCFPSIQEFDISLYDSSNDAGPVSDSDIEALSLALPKLRKVKLSGDYLINDSLLLNICKNCHFLEQVEVSNNGYCDIVSKDGIARAVNVRPNLTCLTVDRKISDKLLFSVARAGLPLRKLCLPENCCGYSYDGISFLLSKCPLIQHLDLCDSAPLLEDKHIMELSKFLGNLMFINLGGCRLRSYLSFFLLTRNCPLLNDIDLQACYNGHYTTFDNEVLNSLMDSLTDSDIIVNFQVKSLRLKSNRGMRDGTVELFTKICPNLEVLDLGGCSCMKNCAVKVLKICPKIKYLSLTCHKLFNLSGLKNFQFPNLEVLRLASSLIDDNGLLILSKSCPGLVELDMRRCFEITETGVKHVVKRCKQLRQIDLTECEGVAPSVVAWMVSSRQSLRKIRAPPQFRISESEKELFLHRGCLVEVRHPENAI